MLGVLRVGTHGAPPVSERASTADWTRKKGQSNSSDEFLQLCEAVERLIRADAFHLIAGRADMTARLIMAQLAHVHGLAPRGRP